MPQLGSCASSGRTRRLWAARHSQEEACPLGAQPLPRVLERSASKAADFTGFDHSGTVAFSCDDALLVTASSVAAMDVWCGRSGVHLRSLTLPHAQPAHTREVYVFECHPVLGHLGFSVTLPRPPTLTLTLTLTPTPISTPHRSPLTFYPNPNPHPHQASYDGTLVLWDLTSGGALRQLEQPRLDENSEVLDGS